MSKGVGQINFTSGDKMKVSVVGSPIDLSVDFQNKFITEELIKIITPTAEVIQQLLKARSKADIQIGEELRSLRNQFRSFAAKNKTTSTEANKAFSDFIQDAFDIGESRANEYIQVSEKSKLKEMKLPISSLVELSRLPEKEFEKLLKDHPVSILNQLTYRSIKDLCQQYNNNSRPRLSTAPRSTGGGSGSYSASNRSPSVSQPPSPSLSLVQTTTTQPPTHSSGRDLTTIFDSNVTETDSNASPSQGLEPVTPTIINAKLKIIFEEMKVSFSTSEPPEETKQILQEINTWLLSFNNLSNEKGE